MKDGCVVANSGYFNVEINIPALEAMAIDKQRIDTLTEEQAVHLVSWQEGT